MKKILSALLMMIFLVSCTSETIEGINPPTTTKAEKLAMGVPYLASEKLNPITTSSTVNMNLSGLIYEGLFVLDKNLLPMPVLCSTYTVDGDTYTFNIKENVLFHSGKVLTADDVAFSLNLAGKTVNSPYSINMQNVESIKVLSPISFSIKLKTISNKFISLLDIPIIEKGSENNGFATGTGPFMPIITASDIYLSAFDSYSGGYIPSIDRINIENIVQTDEQLYSFELGDISLFVADRISANAPAIRGNAISEVIKTTNMHYLGFNHKKAPFDNANTRIAFTYMLNRDEIAKTALQSYADPAYIPINNENMSVKDYFSPEKAKQYFINAGITDINNDGIFEYNNSEFTPEILVNSDNLFKKVATERLIVDLNNIGINAKIKLLPYDEYIIALQKGEFDIYYAETKLTNDFDISKLVTQGSDINYGKANFTANHLQSSIAGKDFALNNFANQFLQEAPIAVIAFTKKQVLLKEGITKKFNPLPFNVYNGIGKPESE